MAGLDDVVEFYVACNPPLLPSGVAFVRRQVQPLVEDETIAEILYEPDVPWFKCIATLDDRERVTRAIQDLLIRILKQDTQPADTNAMILIDTFDRESQPDVKIVAPEPRVMTWSSFKAHQSDLIPQFDHFCYPDGIRDLKHKQMWRGLENWVGGSFVKLLADFKDLVKDDNVPLDAEHFAAWARCSAVSFNMKGDLIYLGSSESKEVVQKAVHRLKNLLALVIQCPRQVTHFIVSQPQCPSARVMYRWLSHIGLSKTTYAQSPDKSLADEYRLLLGAVTLRTETVDGAGHPHPDRTVYYSKPLIETESGQAFRPFQGHTFSPKNAQGPVQGQRPATRQQTAATSASRFLIPVALEQAEHQVPEAGCLLSFDDGPVLRPASAISTRQSSAMGSANPSSETPSDPPRTSRPTAVKAFIHSWRNDVKSATDYQVDMADGDEEDLISFEVDNEVDLEAAIVVAESEDLLCFDTESEHFAPDGEGDTAAARTLAIPTKLQEDPDAVVNFGLMDEEPAHFYRTMGQQASREQSSQKADETADLLGLDWPVLPGATSDWALGALKEIKAQIVQSAAVLRMTPGKISLELVFGRIYLKQFSPSQVFVEATPYFEATETVDFLNSPDFRQDLVGFSPILTTAGMDANRLSEMRPGTDAKWHLVGTQTSYDFTCILNGDQKPFLVSLDADSGQYKIQGARRELLTFYLHCPLQAWDMKVRATRSGPVGEMARQERFAEALVAAVSVCFQGGSSLVIGTPGRGVGGCIEGVIIRQTARYSSRGASQLNITMMTAMEANVADGGGRGGVKGREKARARDGKTWMRRTGSDSGAIPCRWFEASITSTGAEKMLEENRTLELGQMASWKEEQLDKGGILEDLCKPGLAMIEQMDEIGRRNNNEQRLDARDAFREGLMEQAGRGERQPWVFW